VKKHSLVRLALDSVREMSELIAPKPAAILRGLAWPVSHSFLRNVYIINTFILCVRYGMGR